MEPMALGSPVGSPPSPSAYGGSHSPYLPAYLMGEAPSGSNTKSKALSPTKPLKQVSFGAMPVLSPPRSLPGMAESKNVKNLQLSMQSPEKSSGPPTKSLFDTLDEPLVSPRPTRSFDASFQQMNEIMNISCPVEDLSLPQHLLGVDHIPSGLDNTWVTVFGFPPASATFIATHFSCYGMILDRRCPAKGNWMHLRFRSPMEAHKALACNGKVFSGSIMVGVMPCKDQEVIKDSQAKENIFFNEDTSGNRSLNASLLTSPATPVHNTNAQLGTPTPGTSSSFTYLGSPVRISSVRPLNQAYRAAQGPSEVQCDSNTPQKSNSVVTRAMEYVFGW